MDASDPLLAVPWAGFDRRQRRWLGQSLRRAGLSYGEIRTLIPVPKGTLSGWCRGIQLTAGQTDAIVHRTRPPRGAPRDTQRKRRAEIESIRQAAAERAPMLVADPLWVAGVALYWGEGSKSARRVELANSDPRLLRLFMRWVEAFLIDEPDFVASINLHADNDQAAARAHWAEELGITANDFTKTYVKPNGTGHRKNSLLHGVCRVKARRSTDAFITIMAWLDALPALIGTADC